MSSRYSGYLSKEKNEASSTYRREYSSPSALKKLDFSSPHRSSISSTGSTFSLPSHHLNSQYSTLDLKPPLFGSSHGPKSDRSALSRFVPSSSGMNCSTGSSYASNTPSVSHRTLLKAPSFSRSISNDFGVSYVPKSSSPLLFNSGSSYGDRLRGSGSNLTSFESRFGRSSSDSFKNSPGTNSNSRFLYSSNNVESNNITSNVNDTAKENYRTLTSRGTSPDQLPKIPVSSISETKSEKLPLTDTTRRRQLKNVYIQIDSQDFDLHLAGIQRQSKTSSTADPILPKQSGFVPKNRSYKPTQESIRPKALSNTEELLNKQKAEPVVEEYLPPQSSFIKKKLKQDEVLLQKINISVPVTASPAVSLKESIEKVKSWKKQMKFEMPEYNDEDDDREWRKKKQLTTDHGRHHVLNGDSTPNDEEASESEAPKKSMTSSMIMSDDESVKNIIKLSQKRSKNKENKSDRISGFLRKASSYVSLADLNSVEKSEENDKEEKNILAGHFIGRMKDIDSLLDFEDDTGVGHVEEDLIDGEEKQVSCWTDDLDGDIDELLDADIGSSTSHPSKSTSSSKSPGFIRTVGISNNPFVRQSSRNAPKALEENYLENDDSLDLSKCNEIVELLQSLADTEQLQIGQLVDKCKLSENSLAYKKLQNKLKIETKFTGFESIRETLEYLKVNVDQLEFCAVSLYKAMKSENNSDNNIKDNSDLRKYNCLQAQSSIDDENVDCDYFSVKMATKVHILIDFLTAGKELRKILFSLKKIFKNEAHCIREFVHSDGLPGLIKIAEENSSNTSYQCYILRAIGQLMLNVDGMNGIVSVNKVIQWLYNIAGSTSPLIVRTAVRLLLMFVSYSECNSFLFIQAVSSVSLSKGQKIFFNLMEILKKTSGSGDGGQKVDLCQLVLFLINKILESVPDQDSFYDVVDSLSEQGIDKVFWMKTSYGSAKPEFADQVKIFENMIKIEDIRQLQKQQHPQQHHLTDDDDKESKRIPSKTSNRRSLYYSKRDDIIQKEINKRNALRQASQQKLIKEFDSNSISNAETDKNLNTFKKELAGGDFAGLLGKAKIGLAMAQSGDSKKGNMDTEITETPIVKTEAQLKWEEAEKRAYERLKKSDLKLIVKELDFCDVTEVDEVNYLDVKITIQAHEPTKLLAQQRNITITSSAYLSPPPPPPPPLVGHLPPPPPPLVGHLPPPPLLLVGSAPPPPVFPSLPPLRPPFGSDSTTSKKEGHKTLKLHWREARYEFPLPSGRGGDTIWSRISKEVTSVKIDKDELGRLFQSKATEFKVKTESQKKELTLLDSKRSNLINIALTALPQPSLIRTAILNMDHTIINKESVEKILTTLLPSEEEKMRLIEAQLSQPDVPLGTAEQFLITVSSISEVRPRLKLWLFILDFDSVENEISDALSDLRQAMEQVKSCTTLKYALTVLLAVGNCLNSSQAKGFTLDFLSKVPDIKDSIKKRTLLHHLVSFVVQLYAESTDIFSEIGAVTRCARIDWDEIGEKLSKLESGCKASWDDIRAIVKHDNNLNLKIKLSSVLSDFAERTLLLKIAHRRLIHKFREFLLYYGYQATAIASGSEVKVNHFFKVVSEFALEWRTTRSKILHNRKRKEVEKEKKLNSTSNLSLSRSIHGSVSADESTVKKIFSKPPAVPLSNNNNNNKNLYSNLLSPVVPKVSKWPSASSIGYASETESAYETGDEELLGAVIRSATASPSTLRRHSRDGRRKTSVEKSSSWRSNSRDRNGF